MSAWVLLVHPDDVNLADAKAVAAELDATVVGNRFVPRGQIIRTRQSVLDLVDRWSGDPDPSRRNR